MNKIMLSIAAVAALAAAAPAYADHDRRGGGRYASAGYGSSSWLRSVDARAAAIERQAEIAKHNGHISPHLANSIVGAVRGAARTARTYARQGLHESEIQATEQRLRDQEMRLRTGDYYAGEHSRRGYSWRW